MSLRSTLISPTRVGLLTTALLTLWLAVPGMAQALQPRCGQSGQVVTCSYSSPTDAGTTAQFTVPADVSVVHAVVVGGTGAGATDPRCDPWCGGAGGLLSGNISVSAGETLDIQVAGNGNGANGGFGGGGNGCYGGGGASTISASLGLSFVEAPGGGGDGCAGTGSSGTNDPETNGGDTGSTGGAGRNSFDDGSGGQPGGPFSGGAGGTPSGGGGTAGTAGTFQTGGAGGAGVTTGSAVGGAGGGGGGGFPGGGGGGGGSSANSGLIFYAGSGGGGGGGDGVAMPGWSFARDFFQSPRVVISYNVIDFTSGPPPVGGVGQPYSYTYGTAGDSAVAFKVTAGSLPPGLALSATGAISGTPTAAGSYTYFITATGASARQGRFDTIAIAQRATTATTIGNQTTTLQTPPTGACVSNSAGLNVSLTSTILKGRRVRYHFRDAEFFIDKGIAHHVNRRVSSHGKPAVVAVTVFLPNATATHLPVQLNIPISGLRAGTHTLTVKITLARLIHSKTVVAVRTLRTSFAVC